MTARPPCLNPEACAAGWLLAFCDACQARKHVARLVVDPSQLRGAVEVAAGEDVEVTPAVFLHYLGVLPPVEQPAHWRGRRYEFGFAEGTDNIIVFRLDGTRAFAAITNRINRG